MNLLQVPATIYHQSANLHHLNVKTLVKAGIHSLGELETDKTRHLTISQSQRLVLLEELQVLRSKKEKLPRDENKAETYPIHVDSDGGDFQVL